MQSPANGTPSPEQQRILKFYSLSIRTRTKPQQRLHLTMSDTCLDVKRLCAWMKRSWTSNGSNMLHGTASKTCVAQRMSNLPRGSDLRCSRPNMPFSEPSFTTTPPHWHQSQLGKCLCSVAGSSWVGLQSMPLTATAHTLWMYDSSSSGLRTGLLSGPWYVLNVMLLLCRTRRAGTEKQQIQSRIRKVATLARTGEKGRALAAARNALPVPVTEQIVQEIKSLYPTDPEPPAPASAQISALFLSEVAEQVPSTLRKMPRLSEPGPLGMRAEHWYDFGFLAGNSDLFVQVIAHIAAAAVPNPVLQYLKAGQITPLAKPTGGHRPLLMMSFLRILALKSVMAAKKESVAKCAGPFQYGVGRPDGANTMIKTIQYLAEADNSRVLVALDLKAAFQNVSRRAMLHSIAQTDTDLAAVFSRWYTGTTEHRVHYDSAYTKITANSGVDQGCPLSACGFSAVVDPTLHSIMTELCTLYDSGAQLFAYLDDWYLWIKPQCLLQTIAVITTATRSVNLALQSTKTQVWKGSCQDPIPPEFQDKVTLTLSCLGGQLLGRTSTNPWRY